MVQAEGIVMETESEVLVSAETWVELKIRADRIVIAITADKQSNIIRIAES